MVTVRSIWGARHADANRYLLVPVSEFLSERSRFARAATDGGADVALDDQVRALAQTARTDQQSLVARLSAPASLDPDAVARRRRVVVSAVRSANSRPGTSGSSSRWITVPTSRCRVRGRRP